MSSWVYSEISWLILLELIQHLIDDCSLVIVDPRHVLKTGHASFKSWKLAKIDGLTSGLTGMKPPDLE